MTPAVEQILNAFDSLSHDEKVDAVAEIARRAGYLDYSPLDDEILTKITDERFQELDREEQANELA